MQPCDYFEVLGVSPWDSLNVIKAAYRTKIFSAHPDRGGSNDLAALINDAYSVLSDVSKKNEYMFINADEINLKYSKTSDFVKMDEFEQNDMAIYSRTMSMIKQGDKYAEEAILWSSRAQFSVAQKCRNAAMKCWSSVLENYPNSEMATGIKLNMEELDRILNNTPWKKIRDENTSRWAGNVFNVAASVAFVSFFDNININSGG